jgi:hypothetical protein
VQRSALDPEFPRTILSLTLDLHNLHQTSQTPHSSGTEKRPRPKSLPVLVSESDLAGDASRQLPQSEIQRERKPLSWGLRRQKHKHMYYRIVMAMER